MSNYTPGPVTRDAVYEAIDGERLYQDAGAGNSKNTRTLGGVEDVLSVGEGILCIERMVAQAREAWYSPSGVPAALDYIRKVAAVAVQLQENYGVVYRDHEETAFAQRAKGEVK